MNDTSAIRPYRVIKADTYDLFTLASNALSDGTLEVEKTTTSVYTPSPSHKRGKPIWRLNATDDKSNPHHTPSTSAAAITGIKPAEMMHVALNYGGLPGYAYVHSLHDFVGDIEDDMVKEVVARRCDLLTDRAFSIGLMFKEAVARKGGRLVDQLLVDQCLVDNLQTKEAIIENNDFIIRVLSEYDIDEALRECLLKKLQLQLSSLTTSASPNIISV